MSDDARRLDTVAGAPYSTTGRTAGAPHSTTGGTAGAPHSTTGGTAGAPYSTTDKPRAPHATTDALYDVIERRRDVRREFTGEPVDDAVLRRVLGAAHRAPSVGLSQPWDFVLVQDPGTRTRFRDHVRTERDAFAASLPPERRDTFAKIKIEGICESSLGVVITHDTTRGGPQVLGRHAIDDAGLYSTCLAIQNLWLAATAEGLGLGWVSFYREPFLRELLAIPEHVRPIAWLCLGTVSRLADEPDLERAGWRRRRPLEDAIHHETYRSA